MKNPKILVITILIGVLAVSGCSATTTSSTSHNAETQGTVEAKAKTDADIEKAKEKNYYDAVTSGNAEVYSSMVQMASIINNYNSSKAQDLADIVMDISKKVDKVTLIDPPPS